MQSGDTERIEITISSRFENIELVQVIAEHLCENAGVDEDGSHWIGMAVPEAVANAIKHGNKLDVRKKVFATFELEYVPDELCVELKALKLYMWSYRDLGAFHEAVTNQIADDLACARAAGPTQLPSGAMVESLTVSASVPAGIARGAHVNPEGAAPRLSPSA